MSINDVSKLHSLQQEHHAAELGDEERAGIRESWFDESTVDFWRHRHMYEQIEPVAEAFADSRWLTVGDGRFGLDAVRIKKLFGIKNICPSDIAEPLLAAGKERGLFDQYFVENMETLSFEDNAFDVIFCKEAFHHCPRPWLAFYELCRVARTAVILIEPAATLRIARPRRPQQLTKLISAIAGRKDYIEDGSKIERAGTAYEDSGNYLYRLSREEFEQVARGANLPAISWKPFMDTHIPECEFAPAEPGNPIFEKLRHSIEKQEALHKKFPDEVALPMGAAVAWLKPVSDELQKKLEASGHQVVDTRNPMNV
ncbi:MAG: class I SAM-dependent methyltransferase [Verrucomicrobiota bacterium]